MTRRNEKVPPSRVRSTWSDDRVLDVAGKQEIRVQRVRVACAGRRIDVAARRTAPARAHGRRTRSGCDVAGSGHGKGCFQSLQREQFDQSETADSYGDYRAAARAGGLIARTAPTAVCPLRRLEWSCRITRRSRRQMWPEGHLVGWFKFRWAAQRPTGIAATVLAGGGLHGRSIAARLHPGR